MTKIATLLLLLLSIAASAQQLRIKKGNIYNSNLEKLDARQVRFLLANEPELLKNYNAYHDKSIWGGLLLGAGAGLLVTDLAIGLSADASYPSVATYIGGALTAVSIPILIGRKKKLETVVEEFNRFKSTSATGLKLDTVNIVANQNGFGIRASF